MFLLQVSTQTRTMLTNHHTQYVDNSATLIGQFLRSQLLYSYHYTLDYCHSRLLSRIALVGQSLLLLLLELARVTTCCERLTRSMCFAQLVQLCVAQLVQAIRYEAEDHSALSEFLMQRAARSPKLANFFYWYLKVETGNTVSAIH